jgi:hypothetical protein
MFKYEIKKPSSVLKQVNELVKYLQPWKILSLVEISQNVTSPFTTTCDL